MGSSTDARVRTIEKKEKDEVRFYGELKQSSKIVPAINRFLRPYVLKGIKESKTTLYKNVLNKLRYRILTSSLTRLPGFGTKLKERLKRQSTVYPNGKSLRA